MRLDVVTEANITESKVNTIKTLILQVEVCWRLILNELGRTIKRHVETCCLLIIQRFAAFSQYPKKNTALDNRAEKLLK